MPKREVATRRHPVSIRIATTASERKELRRAADKLNLPLSTYVRTVALTATRQGMPVSAEL